jgi:hypothetical protein
MRTRDDVVPRDRRRLLKRLLFGCAALLLLVIAGIGYLNWKFVIFAHQINDLERLKAIQHALEAFHEVHGQYPERLTDISDVLPEGWRRCLGPRFLDEWGHPLVYRSTGSQYLLVSLGRDGLEEHTDYASLRAAQDARICGKPDADFVMSESGWHRHCSK